MKNYYCPNKRHYQSKDLVAAADSICGIGLEIAMANMSISVYKFDSINSSGYVYVELRAIEDEGRLILCAKFDEKLNKFIVDGSPDDFFPRCGEVVSLEKISMFCKNYRKNALRSYIEKISSNLQKKDIGTFYVYRHIFQDGRMYIGKGRGVRYKTIDGRSFAYQRARESQGEPFVEKLCQRMSEESAYELECKLIEELRLHFGIGFLLTKTEGMKKAEIENMPVSTVQSLMNVGRIDPAQLVSEDRVNVFKRYDPEPGSAKMFFKGVTLFDAAKRLNCTIRHLIEVRDNGGGFINGYQILNDADFEVAVNKR